MQVLKIELPARLLVENFRALGINAKVVYSFHRILKGGREGVWKSRNRIPRTIPKLEPAVFSKRLGVRCAFRFPCQLSLRTIATSPALRGTSHRMGCSSN